MTKKQGTAKPKVARENQGSESPVAKPFIPLARLQLSAMSSLDDFDWMSVQAPVALPPDPEAGKAMEIKMGHTWSTYIPVKVVKEWKKQLPGVLLQYVKCHPVDVPAAVIVVPCNHDTEGATELHPSRGGLRLTLNTALLKYKLTWPTKQKLVFPVMIKPTSYGLSLIINVADKKEEDIRPTNKNNDEGKKSKP